MNYLDSGFDDNLTRSAPISEISEVDLIGFDQFTREVGGNKVIAGQIASRDGKIVFDIDSNTLKVSDDVQDRIEIGKLPDGTQGLNIRDVSGKVLMNIAGNINVIKSANEDFQLDLNTGDVTLTRPINFSSLSNGTTFISMRNATQGIERIKIEINSGGFGFITANQYFFQSNTGNSLKENFGVVAQLADSAGTHAFRVYDRDNNEVWRLASNGSMFQRKASYFVLQGSIADPGGQGADTAALFVQQNGGGKDELRVEFNTGASVVIATEP